MSVDKILTYDTDLSADIGYKILHVNLVLGESNGHTIKVNVKRGGTTVTDSATCKAKFLRSDGATVEFNGSFSGGVASVTLPSSCYVKEGACKLSISLTTGSTVSTIFVLVANVRRFSSSSIVADNNQVIPNVEDLLAKIAKIEAIANDVETINKKIGHVEKSGSTLKFYSDSTKSKLIASIDIPAGNDSNKVGYAEYDDGVLSLYADSTKAKLIKAVVIPSGGGTGGGITTSQLKAMIGEIIAVDDDMVTELTEIIMGDSTEELEVPSTEEFNAVKNSVDVVQNASKSAAAGKVWTATSTGAEWKDAPSGGSGGESGNYTKPSDGIPKSDLASSVQSSLSKADTALQSVPSTYALRSDIPTSDISANTAARHTHSNKTYLDKLDDDYIKSLIPAGEGSGLTAAQINSLHTHSNKSVLDGITSAKVSEWNSKSTFSGNYNDLTNKPTLFSGDYNDLTNKPTIPGGGSGVGSIVTPESYGAIANDSSATARAANTKAFKDAITAGYNIVCESGARYYFGDPVDCRTVRGRFVEINMNGSMFTNFHIYLNMNSDLSACHQYDNSPYTFYIHHGTIGSNWGADITEEENKPAIVSGMWNRIEDIVMSQCEHLLALPTNYLDMGCTMNRVTWLGDTTKRKTDYSTICLTTASGYMDFNKSSAYMNGCRGDQWSFSHIQGFNKFVVVTMLWGVSFKNCVGFGVVNCNSNVSFENCHFENGAPTNPANSTVIIDGVTIIDTGNQHAFTSFINCYFEQDALYEWLKGLNQTQLSRIGMKDCYIRVGKIDSNGNSDVPLIPNAYSKLYDLAYCENVRFGFMDKPFGGKRLAVPSELWCSATSISSAWNTSSSPAANTNANQTVGTYNYTLRMHTVNALGVHYAEATASKTYSNMNMSCDFWITNYAGQSVSMYKTSNGKTYRCLVNGIRVADNTKSVHFNDMGAYVAVYTMNSVTVNTGTVTKQLQGAEVWEEVSSIPTSTANTTLRCSGATVYDTSGKLYANNGNSLTAIN